MEQPLAALAGLAPAEPLTPHAARQLGALELAYVGDTVYDLYVRQLLVLNGGGRMKALHAKSVAYVRASAQAEVMRALEPQLTDQERDLVRRARNHASSAPKHAEPADYHLATALEALVGYLYLSAQFDRLDEIMRLALMMG